MEKYPKLRLDEQPKTQLGNSPRWTKFGGKCERTPDCIQLHEANLPTKIKSWEHIFAKHENIRRLIDEHKNQSLHTNQQGFYYQPNIVLANYWQGAVSQAYGWIEIAIKGDIKPTFTKYNISDQYNGDPIEQSMLWLVMNFEPENSDIEIIEAVELLSNGQIEQARDKLSEYMLCD